MMLRRQVLSHVIVVELQVTRDWRHWTEEALHLEEEEQSRPMLVPRLPL